MKERLSQESLERLCIAVVNLKTESGLITNLMPADVLQPWVMEQLPVFEPRLRVPLSGGNE